MTEKLRAHLATFRDVTADGAAFPVQFNPASLQLVLQNTLREQGEGAQRAQYVGGSTARLSMELVFDTTDSGADVRDATGAVAAFMNPVPSESGAPAAPAASGAPANAADAAPPRVPPVVRFEWGTFAFQGIVESYRETIDFFSHDGVPLRATVSLSMVRQDLVFARAEGAGRTAAVGGEGARLAGPVAFASGGAGGGGGAGFGASFGASASLGAGASGGPSFGGSASAGVTASAGAFAGLRGSVRAGAGAGGSAGASSVGGSPDASGVRVGGRAPQAGSASLTTNVGADGLSARLRFE